LLSPISTPEFTFGSTAGVEEARAGRKSQCEPLAAVIMAKVELGLSAQRIYQDLVGENGFTDSY
jgi:hypothetical protein